MAKNELSALAKKREALRAQLAALDNEEKELKATGLADAQAEYQNFKAEHDAAHEKWIADSGYTKSELGITKKRAPAAKRAARKPKGAPAYKHPTTGETASAKGPKPKWLKDELDAGKSLDDFRI